MRGGRQAIVKLVFKLGLLIAGREKDVRSAVSAKKYMASVSECEVAGRLVVSGVKQLGCTVVTSDSH
jgi:hypothetical protein